MRPLNWDLLIFESSYDFVSLFPKSTFSLPVTYIVQILTLSSSKCYFIFSLSSTFCENSSSYCRLFIFQLCSHSCFYPVSWVCSVITYFIPSVSIWFCIADCSLILSLYLCVDLYYASFNFLICSVPFWFV